MVGVPGRSKGCVTCRRRKKGCDLKRPVCGQCSSRNLVCGGYDNDRMFVNHTAAPAQLALRPTTSNATTHAFASSSYPRASTLSPPVDFRLSNPAHIPILPDGLTRSAYGEKSVEAFFIMYAPNRGTDIYTTKMLRTTGFASVLSILYVRDEALRLALLALGTAMLGKMGGDEQLIRQGRKLYGRGLEEMGKALGDEKRAKSEALLAVPRIAGMFEMLFGSDVNPSLQAQSWRSHAQGELALMKSRGPKAHVDNVAHQIFVDGRLSPVSQPVAIHRRMTLTSLLIIAAIRTRKACILNNVEWKTVPWEKYPKTPKDMLLDILVGVPEILEDVDKLTDDPANGELLASTVVKCMQLDAELKIWASHHSDLIYEPAVEEPVAFTFADLSTAYLTLFYWTTCLILYESMEAISALSPPTPPTSISYPPPRTFARRIALSVPYFFDSQRGVWGAVSVAFPMGYTLLYLRRSGTAADKAFMMVIFKAWCNPKLPGAIRDFLNSMRKESAGMWLKQGWSRERVGNMFDPSSIPPENRTAEDDQKAVWNNV